MRDELLGAYERELTYLRRLGAEFAGRYPKIAARLALEQDKCDDPHVERLIESVAFLCARVRLKIDDDFPEITDALLSVLYPSFLAPVPSTSIVQFVLDPNQASLQVGKTLPRGSMLASRPVDGAPCRFQTAYPVTLWPIELTAARFELPGAAGVSGNDARLALRLSFKTFSSLPLKDLRMKVSEAVTKPLSSLRLFLSGEGKLTYALYELLFNDLLSVELRPQGAGGANQRTILPKENVAPVGFTRDEGIFPDPQRRFRGYHILKEYFTFPEKFLFLDLVGLDPFTTTFEGDAFDVVLVFSKDFADERAVTRETFRLFSTPIVNLFRQQAEPVRITHRTADYRVIPDVRRQRALEVYSVEGVTAARPDGDGSFSYQPFFSFRHGADREGGAFWIAKRRPSQVPGDDGTEVLLSFVDLGFKPERPGSETVSVETICTNRDLPGKLPFGRGEGDFQLEGPGVFSAIRCLKKPSAAIRPALGRGAHWRLLSHLSLNYLSLVERDGDGPDALREILKLYDMSDSPVTRQQIAGISKVSSRRVARMLARPQPSFARGLEVTLEVDESQFVGSGAFLFGQILERFLGLYTSINSFTQVVLTSQQRDGIMRRWPPRTGEQLVL